MAQETINYLTYARTLLLDMSNGAIAKPRSSVVDGSGTVATAT
jgi:hypothetical protein